jgi:hypothetical protein
MQERLLHLAILLAPPDVKPTLAYLERRLGLKTGALKEPVRRRGISKPLMQQIIDAGPRVGLVGLTADWLWYNKGDPPTRGEMPPPKPQGKRSARDRTVVLPGLPGQAQIARAVGLRVERLTEQILQAKGPIEVAQLVLGIASQTDRTHAPEVRSLVDYARLLLEAHGVRSPDAPDRGEGR